MKQDNKAEQRIGLILTDIKMKTIPAAKYKHETNTDSC